jgi:protein-S-isoprenylcysteine O-methyltransferase Ste14
LRVIQSVHRTLRNIPLPEPILASLGVSALLDRMIPLRVPGVPTLYRRTGVALVVVGLGIIVSAVAAARDVDIERPEVLLVSGPYRISRNPMYVAWGLIHIGAGSISRSAWFAATLPLAGWLVHREVLAEERELEHRFGNRYRRYVSAVPRYLPGVQSGRNGGGLETLEYQPESQ